MTDEKFESMIIYAERYAIGRSTYAADDVVEYIFNSLSFISDRTLHTIERDIEEYFAHSENPLAKESEWNFLLSCIKAVLKSRKDTQNER